MTRPALVSCTLLVSLLACGRAESLAVEELQSRGYVDVELTANEGGSFDYKARKGDDVCLGTIGVNDDGCGSRNTVLFEFACRPPEGPVEKALPESANQDVRGRAAQCDEGNHDKCSDVALAYIDGTDGVPADVDVGRLMMVAACEAGSKYACYNIGNAYLNGSWMGKDLAEARTHWIRGCEGGHGVACQNASVWHTGDIAGTTRDDAQALAYADKGCALDNAQCCYQAGFLIDQGRAPGERKAGMVELFDKGCAGGEVKGCISAGNAFEMGITVDKDAREAAKRFEKACALGSAEHCK